MSAPPPPEDLASVTAANRDRLMGVAAAISRITNSERHMIDLADLEAKARAATHGEWSVLTSSLDSTRSIMAGDPAFFLARCHKSPVSDATANAAYIAAAQPRVVLELIERIRAAEAKAGEPVAWMIEHPREGKSVELARFGTRPLFPDDEEAGFTASPLYAAPVDAADEIERLTAELTATLAKLVQYEQGPVFYADARELAAARLGEGDEVWLQTKPYNYDDVQLIVRPEASHE